MKERFHILNHLLNSDWYYDRAEGMRVLPYVLSMCMGPEAFGGQLAEVSADIPPRPKSSGFSDFLDPVQFGYGLYSGVVGKNLKMSESGFDLRWLERDLRTFADSPTQHTFFVHLDTPGGAGFGLRHMAELMALITRDTGKSIVGYVDKTCCSAGAWLGAGCGQFYMDPDALGGSIGVYSVLLTARRALEAAGIDAEMFSSGKYKGAGHPAFELTDEQRAQIQARIEGVGETFRAEMKRMRGFEIPRDFMEGQALTADECMDAGICDGIVKTFDELVAMYAR